MIETTPEYFNLPKKSEMVNPQLYEVAKKLHRCNFDNEKPISKDTVQYGISKAENYSEQFGDEASLHARESIYYVLDRLDIFNEEDNEFPEKGSPKDMRTVWTLPKYDTDSECILVVRVNEEKDWTVDIVVQNPELDNWTDQGYTGWRFFVADSNIVKQRIIQQI